ncbi:PAS domain-containing protein [Sphingobium sp. BHU LFT2]|uniref:PAS domain-containing protein n=1 Tax=Sphingobium sp. BHU LFT2 TaxID=2807634 RepID=UPI001BE55DB9|nr:PAS domain-containing protein [Sphingobium sp. BHU LFT2]MBT2246803.1 PAS domain-containing protein [Sphingobium sp. BHU LFT2]
MADQSEMMRRQRALADFGDFVLDHEDLDEILNEGCRLIAEALVADLAKVLEIERESNTALVRAGVGWRPGIVGHERFSLSERSSEAFAIERTEPVITNDIASEDRFEFPPFLREHGVIAIVNVPILLPGRRPWGVLQVDAREPREFDQASIEFLKTYSMVLGPVIDRILVAAEREQARSGLAAREERQTFLLALGDAMRAKRGAREKVEVAARCLGERLSATRVLFAEFDEVNGIADIFGGWSADGLPAFPAVMRLEDHEGPIMDDLRAGRTVRIDDVRHLVDQPAFAAVAQVGVGALLSVPLLVDNKLLVNLSVHQKEARRWTDAEVALVQEVAERLWAEVVRARTEIALGASEERYRELFERIDQGFCIIEVIFDGDAAVDYRLLDVNPAFERRTGIADGKGRRMRDIAPEHEQHWFDIYGEIALTGEPRRFEARADALGRWYSVYAFCVDEPEQRRVGILFEDIGERKRAEEALRESEERLRQFGEASQDVLWIRDAETMQWKYLTPAFEAIYGLSREEVLTGDNFRSWLELIVPEDRNMAVENIRRVRQGEPVTFEYRIRRPVDGGIRWLRNTDFPIAGEDGAVNFIGGIGSDITDSKRTQELLMRSEERLRSAVEVGRLGLWDWNVLSGEIHWSDEHFRMEGYAVGEVTPSYEAWAARIHPDDRPGAEAALHHAQETHEEFDHEFRTVHPDGSVRWLHGRGRFFYDESAQAIRMVGAMTDTTARREWEERQQVLVAELQHRTRNLMGVVRSMSDKTARASADLADFRSRFRDRLDALARVQGLLSRLNEHDRVSFDELIRTELTAMDGGSDRVTLDGPAGIRVRSSTVQTLAMALHELATNAVKYGALGQPQARLAVTWAFEPAGPDNKPWLHIDWRESGVEMHASGSRPTGTGQGRELIEHALPYQLRAKTSYTLGSDGVHCTISMPVSESTTEVSAHA